MTRNGIKIFSKKERMQVWNTGDIQTFKVQWSQRGIIILLLTENITYPNYKYLYTRPTLEAKVPCGHFRSPATIWPVWLQSSSIACISTVSYYISVWALKQVVYNTRCLIVRIHKHFENIRPKITTNLSKITVIIIVRFWYNNSETTWKVNRTP